MRDNGILSSHQSGFQQGDSTIEPIVLLMVLAKPSTRGFAQISGAICLHSTYSGVL